MRTYIPAYSGYIADVPTVWFRRNDGRVFCFDQLSRFKLNPKTQTAAVSAGWHTAPVAYIPSNSSIEILLTTPEFSTEQFSLLEGTDSEKQEDVEEYVVEQIDDYQKQLKTQYDNIVFNSVELPGYQYVDHEPSSGEFTIVRNANGSATLYVEDDRKERATTAILGLSVLGTMILNDGADFKDEFLSYTKLNRSARDIKLKNIPCATGECVIRYPVYMSSKDCMSSAIKGYVVIKIFKARVMAEPSFNSSYKSSNEFTITINGIDAKREDKKQYAIGYYNV